MKTISDSDPFGPKKRSRTKNRLLAKAEVHEDPGDVNVTRYRLRPRTKRTGSGLTIARDQEPLTTSKSPGSLGVLAMDEIDESPRANTISDDNSRRGHSVVYAAIPIKRTRTTYNMENELAPIGSGSAGGKKKRRLVDPFGEPQPGQWTHKNPDWRNQWKESLVYPATGKNRAVVDADDIARLDEGEFFNDNLISFYLRYMQAELERDRPEVLQKVHIFSSFFFEKLKSSAKYEGVKSWTAKIDLFSYDYIVVPVNEYSHWYLAIICNVGQILPEAQSSEQAKVGRQDGEAANKLSPKVSEPPAKRQAFLIEDDLGSTQTVDGVPSLPWISSEQLRARQLTRGSPSAVDTSTPKIVTLDSLDGSHSGTRKTLENYLQNEARDKKGIDLPFLPGGMKCKVPRQSNFCDCGVFLLGYMEEFLKDPDKAARCFLQKEKLDWDIRPRELRMKIRDLLFDLQKEYQARLVEEQAKERAAVPPFNRR